MSFYFHISNGLRGCYMPDNAYVARVETRRELVNLLSSEARDMREAYGFGGAKREVSRVAAEAWRNRRKATLDHAIPFGREKGNYPFGLFVSSATRRDYVESRDSEI